MSITLRCSCPGSLLSQQNQVGGVWGGKSEVERGYKSMPFKKHLRWLLATLKSKDADLSHQASHQMSSGLYFAITVLVFTASLVYQFPIAAVANYHNLVALNKTNLFSYSCGGADVWNQLHWANAEAMAGPHWKGESVPHLSQLLELQSSYSLVCGPFLHLQSLLWLHCVLLVTWPLFCVKSLSASLF